MDYKLYLHTLCQLSSKGRAAVTYDGHMLHIEPLKQNNTWRFSAPIFDKGRHSALLHSCLSQAGTFRWQGKGAYLRRDLDTDALALIEEVNMNKASFIAFKRAIEQFISTVRDWHEN
ncbi:MAG TPA: type III secretion system chaperone [Rhabdochlamydiaceae bacterium]|jgi:hypothetical protein